MKHTRLTPPAGRRLRAAAFACLVSVAGVPLFAGAPTEPNSPTRLSSNENAFGFTPKALARMQAALEAGNYYNRNEVDEMVKLCAAYERVKEDYILPTAGSGPVLMLTAFAYAKPGKNVVTTSMGYTQLTRAFAEHGGDVKFASLSGAMGYDFKALARAIDDNTVIVYICNPNNPTGVLASPGELRKFILSVPEHILVFVDEAYLELSDTGLIANTAAPLVKLRKNLIVSRTFSKGHAMAGLRAGYGIGNPEVLAKLEKFYTGGPSYLAAIAAQEAIKDKAHLEANRKKYKEVRDYVCKEFDRMGITYSSPQGAFIFFRSGMAAKDLVAKMKESKILISGSRESGVPEGAYGDWARVSIGTKEEMDLFLGELTKALGKT
ncbi:MAG TPA: histidinol-phosphate transaminase [Opitutaceae bacterium]